MVAAAPTSFRNSRGRRWIRVRPLLAVNADGMGADRLHGAGEWFKSA
ncbi:MAG: hypothetical protein ACXVIZ_10325 [Halobacteriota archaeon]